MSLQTLIFRQYTAEGRCITAAGVEEVDVTSPVQAAEVIASMASEGWLHEATVADGALL